MNDHYVKLEDSDVQRLNFSDLNHFKQWLERTRKPADQASPEASPFDNSVYQSDNMSAPAPKQNVLEVANHWLNENLNEDHELRSSRLAAAMTVVFDTEVTPLKAVAGLLLAHVLTLAEKPKYQDLVEAAICLRGIEMLMEPEDDSSDED